jgi:hypothetical protein
MDLIHSNISSASKLPSYIGTSTFALVPNFTTTFNTCSLVASSPVASSIYISSLFASLMSPVEDVLLCISSIASNLPLISLTSLPTTQFTIGGCTRIFRFVNFQRILMNKQYATSSKSNGLKWFISSWMDINP